MSRIVLIRHAATEWSGARLCGRTDPSLSAAGRAQLDGLCERVTSLDLGRVLFLTSPARRARETAEPVAARLGAAIVTDTRLCEADLGEVEGLTFEEIDRGFPAVARALYAGDDRIDWPRGETADQFEQRVGAVARDLEDATDVDRVVVSHGGPIRLLLARSGIVLGHRLEPSDLVVLADEPPRVIEVARSGAAVTA